MEILTFIASILLGLFALFIVERFILKNREISSTHLIVAHLLIGATLLTINIYLYRNWSLSGQANFHDFEWIVRRLINLEQIVLTIVHPFDILAGHFLHGKPFETSWTYELSRILTLPLSTGTYLVLRREIK